jgi:signal transduction histidine kinase
MVGICLVGGIFYGQVNSYFLGAIIGQALGPYSDTLAEHGFADPDPDIWRRMAARHEVAILVEPVGGDPFAFDKLGESVSPSTLVGGRMLAVRTAEDGTRVTFTWALSSFRDAHLPLLGGLLIMLAAVVGSAFWFLHLQLKPLAWLHTGVNAVARGDFTTRVPVVRKDEIGQVAEAFNVMASRVGEMIDDRERLLADVSHELRSPIARMKVALEFVPQGDKRDALARDMREMESLITVLLERAKLTSQASRPADEDIDLCALTREVAAAFAGQGPGVEFVSGGAVIIHADPALVKLLIQNLIDNAIKFSHPDSLPVVAKLETGPDQVVLRVTDDGMGFPTGSEEQLFKPFVKADRARGHRVGYGVGLNLCQRIVQLHGGTIRMLPSQPRGTEVVVTFYKSPRPVQEMS